MRFRLLVFPAFLIAPAAAAQVSVTPVRDLTFGQVIAGVASAVPPTHPTRSGQFRFTAPLLSRVQLRFTLPDQLDGPAGASLPITFGNDDAIYAGTFLGSAPTTFNPKSTRNVQLLLGTTYNVFIGGTVSPPATQRPGSYAAPIILTVTIQ